MNLLTRSDEELSEFLATTRKRLDIARNFPHNPAYKSLELLIDQIEQEQQERLFRNALSAGVNQCVFDSFDGVSEETKIRLGIQT